MNKITGSLTIRAANDGSLVIRGMWQQILDPPWPTYINTPYHLKIHGEFHYRESVKKEKEESEGKKGNEV